MLQQAYKVKMAGVELQKLRLLMFHIPGNICGCVSLLWARCELAEKRSFVEQVITIF